MKLRNQMILQIAGPALLIYIVILSLATTAQYKQSRREVERAATRLAASYSLQLDGHLREAAGVAETTAKMLETGVTLTDDEVFKQLENNVRQLPLIYGSCLAFEPGTRRPAGELFAPYVHRAGNGLNRMIIDQSVYDWYRHPSYTWYRQPKELGHSVWSAPYFDKGAGNILMSTFSAPFKTAKGFGGVCTVDIDLPTLQETVGREIDQQLDFVILTGDGRYVFHPDPLRILDRTILEYADHSRGGLSAIKAQMLSGNDGAAWLDGWETDEPIGVFYAPIPSAGWVFVARVPSEQVLADVRHRTLQGVGALAAALVLIAASIWVVAGRIAAPISALEQHVTEIGEGNLEARIEEASSTAEIQSLAHSFNRMTADLRSNLERLAVEKAERQRIERDLDIAREIQQSLLPTTKPDLAEYDVAGWSCFADKTGGDYFDWQMLPDGRVLISIADVSGHGLGPALVAAVCRAYARASVGSDGRELAHLIRRVNDLLITDLPEGRFVTFAGVLIDSKSHQAYMLSAGHGPLYRCLATGGEVIELGADDIPLGIASDNPYGPASQFSLDPGDFILLITDGLFEWTNSQDEAFGLERMRDAIRAARTEASEELIRSLFKSVQDFVSPSPQLDDVTIVVIRRRTTKEMLSASKTGSQGGQRVGVQA